MVRRWTLALAGSIIVVALAGCGGDGEEAATTTSEAEVPGGEILFTRLSAPESKRASLFRVAADGSGLRLFVRDAAEAAVSPNGRRLAFVRGDAIWLMGRDGSHQEQLTRPPAEIADFEPAWSADGRTIFFTREDDLEGFSLSIYSVRSDGSGLRHLTESDPNAEPGESSGEDSPAPPPKGRIVAFVSWLDSKTCGCALSRIAAMTPTGRPAALDMSTAFADDSGLMVRGLAWAPDGRRMVFAADDAYAEGVGRSGIYVSTSDGKKRIMRPRRSWDGVREPAWSPDGAWIAFTAWGWTSDEMFEQLWLVRADGTAPRRLTEGRADSQPVWLPSASS